MDSGPRHTDTAVSLARRRCGGDWDLSHRPCNGTRGSVAAPVGTSGCTYLFTLSSLLGWGAGGQFNATRGGVPAHDATVTMSPFWDCPSRIMALRAWGGMQRHTPQGSRPEGAGTFDLVILKLLKRRIEERERRALQQRGGCHRVRGAVATPKETPVGC